ncbi:MAG: hypothetical protein R2863_04960 [Candidatus Kapaibacterium sp.]|nr:hypothetical protein [Ignavibacteria bacterium]
MEKGEFHQIGNVRTVIADYKNISNMYPYGKSYGTNAIYNATDDYRQWELPSLSVAKEGLSS